MSNGLSKKQICEKVGVSTKTFERFLDSQGKDLGEAEGQSHERFYGEETVQKFKAWLKQISLIKVVIVVAKICYLRLKVRQVKGK